MSDVLRGSPVVIGSIFIFLKSYVSEIIGGYLKQEKDVLWRTTFFSLFVLSFRLSGSSRW